MELRPTEHDWVAITAEPLSLDAAATWVARPECGAVVTFSGTVRDHAEGRPGVSRLEYEAYEEQVVARLATLVAQARRRWKLGRIVCWHRVGALGVGESAVVVAVSAAHRAEAFEAARWCIDTIKATAPIWKRETWAGGQAWGGDAHEVTELRMAAGGGR